MYTTSLRLEKDLAEQAAIVAKKERRSFNGLVAYLLEKHIEDHKRKEKSR